MRSKRAFNLHQRLSHRYVGGNALKLPVTFTLNVSRSLFLSDDSHVSVPEHEIRKVDSKNQLAIIPR